MQDIIRDLQGFARCSAYLGSHDRIGQHLLPLPERTEADGLLRCISQRDSSGSRVRRGGVTKAGNAHLRRIVVESAWVLSTPASRRGKAAQATDEGVPPAIIEISWKPQNRLHKRYMKLSMAAKDQRKIMTAVARELLGFIWAIAIKAEASCRQPIAA